MARTWLNMLAVTEYLYFILVHAYKGPVETGLISWRRRTLFSFIAYSRVCFDFSTVVSVPQVTTKRCPC